MKKLLCLVLALVLATSIFTACGKKNEDNADTPKTEETGKPAESGEVTEESKAAAEGEEVKEGEKAPEAEVKYDIPEPSENKEVVTEEKAPDVYIVMDSPDNKVSISYHLKDCKLIKGSNPQQIAWEMVKTLGFHQCPECNPPRYEGYVE